MVHLGILKRMLSPQKSPFYLKVQLIEQVLCNDADKDMEAILWEREKYW